MVDHRTNLTAIKYMYRIIDFDFNKSGFYEVEEIPLAEGLALMRSQDWKPTYHHAV